ncbi:MAG TPA: helix-turn-helix domain-containing protein [Candidatus Paceibacterota bacterium]
MSKKVDDNSDRDLLKKLEELGLTEKEGLVYMALLPRQDTGSSKLIRATGLHGQFVYDALAHLEELGLARHVVQSGRKKFSATTPTRLLSLLEEKRLTAQAVVKKLQTRFVRNHEQDFEVFQGESAFSAHQWDMLERIPQNSEVLVICGPTEHFLATLGDTETDEFERRRVEKGMSVRYIGMEPMRKRLADMRKWRKLWEYRVFPGQSTGLVDTDIWPDNVTFNIFGNPVLSFTIWNKEVAHGHKEFFEALWAVSKP